MADRKRRNIKPNKNNESSKPAHKYLNRLDLAKYQKLAICIAVVILFAGIPFGLGKYIEFNTPGPFDSSSYVYSAQHIAEGARMFVDEKPSAQPATLLINFIGVKLFGFSEFGPKLIQMLLQLTALALVFIAVRKLYGSLAACVSVVLASLYLSAPLIAKFGNVKEQFMISFMLISACCFMISQIFKRRWWIWTLLCGAAAINIYYFKQTGASVIVGIILYLTVKLCIDIKNCKNVFHEILVLIGGAFLGIIPLSAFYLWQGQLPVLMKTLPMTALVAFFNIAVLAVIIYTLVRFIRSSYFHSFVKQLSTVRKPLWITGLALIFVTFFVCAYHWNNRVIVGIDLKGDQLKQQLEIMQNQDEVEYYLSLKKSDIPLERGGLLDEYIQAIPLYKYPAMLIKYPFNKMGILKEHISGVLKKAFGSNGYIGASRKQLDIKQQTAKVFRFYKALIVPILFAIASTIAAAVVFILRILHKKKQTSIADRLVIMLAAWWILDMIFVWISPRSYEQYYLPLTASAAVLAGYICSLYTAKLSTAKKRPPMILAGVVVFLVISMMTYPIFAGQSKSPHAGTEYKRTDPRTGTVQQYKRFGFAQSLERVKNSKAGAVGPWEKAGIYINEHTKQGDTIYVWGWYPGIYVKAQRLSSAKKAFESEMHVRTPRSLSREVNYLLTAFEKDPPKYIVDSRKSHFPWNRPPLELWPTTSKGLLPNNPQIIQKFDNDYSQMLASRIDSDEAARYKAMAPFRKFVMDNYQPAEPKQFVQSGGQYVHRMFGTHRVFRLKSSGTQR